MVAPLTCHVKAAHGIRVGELESEFLGVVVESDDINELQVNEALISASEGLGSSRGRCCFDFAFGRVNSCLCRCRSAAVGIIGISSASGCQSADTKNKRGPRAS